MCAITAGESDRNPTSASAWMTPTGLKRGRANAFGATADTKRTIDEWNAKIASTVEAHRTKPWYHLEIIAPNIAASPETHFADKLIDDRTTTGTCPLGHLGAANIVGEIWLADELEPGYDIQGLTPGLGYVSLPCLYAYRPLIISQRFRKALERRKLQGTYLEIARVAPRPSRQ
jgi:hypothetical protein